MDGGQVDRAEGGVCMFGRRVRVCLHTLLLFFFLSLDPLTLGTDIRGKEGKGVCKTHKQTKESKVIIEQLN
jgi:hypothetical protein